MYDLKFIAPSYIVFGIVLDYPYLSSTDLLFFRGFFYQDQKAMWDRVGARTGVGGGVNTHLEATWGRPLERA